MKKQNIEVRNVHKKLLLFDDELDKLKETGWDYEVIYSDPKKKIYAVKVDIPHEICELL